MGTPDFAIPSLRILHEAGHEIVAVVTAPDKPSGRGLKLRPSPIKQYAVANNLPVLQPVKLRNPEFNATLKSLEADLMVVVAFRMLPEMVWSIPKIGTFNLHASYLPDYRGAAPINWVVINGEEKTGATTFFIDKQIDTGNILLQTAIEIPYEWTAGDLHDYMMEEGAKLVLETVQQLEAGTVSAKPQDNSLYKHKAPKIFKEDCEIDWSKDAETLYNFIRGLSPYPTAWTTFDGKQLKVFRAYVAEGPDGVEPGTFQRTEELELKVACGKGWIQIIELQLAGKKRMKTADFLRGYREG